MNESNQETETESSNENLSLQKKEEGIEEVRQSNRIPKPKNWLDYITFKVSIESTENET